MKKKVEGTPHVIALCFFAGKGVYVSKSYGLKTLKELGEKG